MRYVFFAAVILAGCASQSTREDEQQDQPALTSKDAGHDTATADAGEEPMPCTCDFHWSTGPEQIICYPRGGCAVNAVCVPVLPLTEEPACRLE